jgi:hypothetical protein
MILVGESSWWKDIGTFGSAGVVVGGAIMKLLTIGTDKRKADTEITGSLFERATKMINVLQSQIDRFTEENGKLQMERLALLDINTQLHLQSDQLRTQLSECCVERDRLRIIALHPNAAS